MMSLPQFASSSPLWHWEYPLQRILDLKHFGVFLHLMSPSYGHAPVTKIKDIIIFNNFESFTIHEMHTYV